MKYSHLLLIFCFILTSCANQTDDRQVEYRSYGSIEVIQNNQLVQIVANNKSTVKIESIGSESNTLLFDTNILCEMEHDSQIPTISSFYSNGTLYFTDPSNKTKIYYTVDMESIDNITTNNTINGFCVDSNYLFYYYGNSLYILDLVTKNESLLFSNEKPILSITKNNDTLLIISTLNEYPSLILFSFSLENPQNDPDLLNLEYNTSSDTQYDNYYLNDSVLISDFSTSFIFSGNDNLYFIDNTSYYPVYSYQSTFFGTTCGITKVVTSLQNNCIYLCVQESGGYMIAKSHIIKLDLNTFETIEQYY